MTSFHALLHLELSPQVYRMATCIAVDELRQLALAHDLHFCYVNGSTIDDKNSFLRHTYAALNFPDYVAGNWDAFEEAIRDLEWLTPRAMLLFYDYVDPLAVSHTRQWTTALQILRSAVQHWRETDRPLYVLLSGADASLDGLPEIA